MLIVPCNNFQCLKHGVAAHDNDNYYQSNNVFLCECSNIVCTATGLIHVMMRSASYCFILMHLNSLIAQHHR